ncbi:MAG: hypothetical protein CMJ18_06555 [Phycisphaeraceae bacterium]|nr:hypothetical protein [Phycisphaeraceae bacterium]
MYWTIGSFPELGVLTVPQRRVLLKQCAGARTYVWLVIKAWLMAALVSILLSPVLLRFMPHEVNWIVGVVLILLSYQFLLLRIRASLRLQIKIAYKGQKLPMCLDCGYDLESVTTSRCPECGAPIRVPKGGGLARGLNSKAD